MHRVLSYILLFSFQMFYSQQAFDYVNYDIDEGLPSSNVKTLYQDSYGFILVGTDKGVVRFNGYDFENNTEDFNHVTNINPTKPDDSIKSFFNKYTINVSLKDNQGSWWIGTENNGLFYIPNFKGLRHVITKEKVFSFKIVNDSIDFIFNNMSKSISKTINPEIARILKDENINSVKNYNNLDFIATDRGVFIFKTDAFNAYVLIDKHRGLLSNKVIDIELFKNDLYIATQKGVSIFDLNFIDSNIKSANVIFPYVRLNNDKFLFPKKEIVVQPDHRFLTLRYLCLDYKAKGDLIYKYKIEGIHDDWIITKDTKIQFTSLPQKGEYVFNVKVKGPNDSWSKPSSIKLIFLQAFYKTYWFITICILSILTIIGFILRSFYLKNINNQRLKSELLKLESSALQSQMNPHFVFNALNSIQSFISTGNDLKAEIYLSKFSNLLRRTLNSSRLNLISLDEEVESLTMYLELEKLRFGEKLNYKIEVDENLETDFIKIPPMLVQPFVENAILHGISPKAEQGNVLVSFKMLSEAELLCTIVDDGVGRKNNTNSAHKSLGVDIVKKRLSIITIGNESFVKYTDLLLQNNQPGGTKVEFIIPI